MAAVLAGWSTVMSNRSSGLRVPQPRRVPTGAACAPELHRESAENLAATSNQLPESLMFDFELVRLPPIAMTEPGYYLAFAQRHWRSLRYNTNRHARADLLFSNLQGDETADFPPACKVHPDPERLQKALDEIRPYSRPRDTLEAKVSAFGHSHSHCVCEDHQPPRRVHAIVQHCDHNLALMTRYFPR